MSPSATVDTPSIKHYHLLSESMSPVLSEQVWCHETRLLPSEGDIGFAVSVTLLH
jgi:hypothetical protein